MANQNYINDMKRLTQTHSFRTLSSKESTVSQIRKATDELIEEIIELSDSEADDASLFRIMSYTWFILQMLLKKSPNHSYCPILFQRITASAFHRIGYFGERSKGGEKLYFFNSNSIFNSLDGKNCRFSRTSLCT